MFIIIILPQIHSNLNIVDMRIKKLKRVWVQSTTIVVKNINSNHTWQRTPLMIIYNDNGNERKIHNSKGLKSLHVIAGTLQFGCRVYVFTKSQVSFLSKCAYSLHYLKYLTVLLQWCVRDEFTLQSLRQVNWTFPRFTESGVGGPLRIVLSLDIGLHGWSNCWTLTKLCTNYLTLPY